MSKNIPTTQYLDFNNDKWNITDSNTYTKDFDKFYSKPEGQLIIKNLSIVKTETEATVPVADIVAVPMNVIKDRIQLGAIKYQPYKFDITGGTVTINLSYNLRANVLTAKFSFMASGM